MSSRAAGEQGEPVGPTAEEQLTALIAALPDPADIDPEDEEQVERISDQISEIYAYAEEQALMRKTMKPSMP